ncbi:MAG: TIM barrel protein, partial [Planctomycetota bacterium]
ARALGLRLGPVRARALERSGRAAWAERRAAVDAALEVAVRTGSGLVTLDLPLPTPEAERETWRVAALACLRDASARCAAAEVGLALEPLEAGPELDAWDGWGEAVQLARAAGPGRVGLVFDVERRQRVAGALSAALAAGGEALAFVRLSDCPGRTEPGSGEVHFPHLLRRLDALRFDGLLALDHGASLPGATGAERVLERYRELERAAPLPWRGSPRSQPLGLGLDSV